MRGRFVMGPCREVVVSGVVRGWGRWEGVGYGMTRLEHDFTTVL